MSRALLTLNGTDDRERAIHWIRKAPAGTRVEFKASKRSLDQNSKLWASLSDISVQLKWHGEHLTPDEWKILFLDAMNRETRPVPGINGGIVRLGRSSSDLSKEEFSNLLDLIGAFGANHGVIFHDQPVTEAA